MLQAALLWYSKFREDLESKGFKFNPYDPCVTNRMKSDKQHTIIFHVDDLKSSQRQEGERQVQKMVARQVWRTREGQGASWCKAWLSRNGARLQGEIVVDMSDYIKDMLGEFPVKFKDKEKVATPAANHLFEAGNRRRLDCNWAEIFHMVVAKGLFISKQA